MTTNVVKDKVFKICLINSPTVLICDFVSKHPISVYITKENELLYSK